MKVVIEQLNKSQWHATGPEDWSCGVGNWVRVVGLALDWAALNGFAVVNRAHQEEPLTLMRAEVGA